MIKIRRDDLVGVWENQDVAPFKYDDNLEITLYLGAGESNTIEFVQGENIIAYHSDGLEVSGITDGKFTITFRNSELNDGNDICINCRMYLPNQPKAFIANINNSGDRYFERK